MKLFRDGEKEETGYREENYVHLCVATQELQERYRLSSEGWICIGTEERTAFLSAPRRHNIDYICVLKTLSVCVKEFLDVLSGRPGIT